MLMRVAGIAGCVLLIGCKAERSADRFTPVQQAVLQRSGHVVQWRGVSAEDAKVDAAVGALLVQPLTADAAAQIALLNNRHLQATFEEIGIAQADLVQAGLLKNPVFDFSVRVPTRPPSKNYLDISVATDFIQAFLIPARKKLAGTALEQAQLRVTDQVLASVAETKGAFYAYQGAQQMAEMRESVAQAASASADAASRLREAGNIAEPQRLAEQTQAARTQVELEAARAEAAEAREHLNDLMGLAMDEGWKIEGRLADVPAAEAALNDLESVAMRERQDLAAARSDVEIQAQSLGFANDTAFFSAADVGIEGERETDGQWRIGPSLAVPLPLFDQGQAVIARQQAIFRQSRDRYRAMVVDVRSQVRSARAKMLAARTRAQAYQQRILPLEQQLVSEMQLQYNGMFVGIFQLLEARREQIDAGAQFISALREYWTARAELERVVGQSFPPAKATASGPATQTAPTEEHHHHHGGQS
jgi:cobalt-zinc-cadmium efflux system outer membrane protein